MYFLLHLDNHRTHGTKIGKVLVKNASNLFKRWIARGPQVDPNAPYHNDYVDASTLVWPDSDSRELAFSTARKEIDELTNDVYTLTINEAVYHLFNAEVNYPRFTNIL